MTKHHEQKKGPAEQRLADEQAARLAKEQYETDFKWLMEHAAGRRLMHGWLASAGIYRRSFTGNSETFHREGRREFGLELLEGINTICPKQYLTMLEEQQK